MMYLSPPFNVCLLLQVKLVADTDHQLHVEVQFADGKKLRVDAKALTQADGVETKWTLALREVREGGLHAKHET